MKAQVGAFNQGLSLFRDCEFFANLRLKHQPGSAELLVVTINPCPIPGNSGDCGAEEREH